MNDWRSGLMLRTFLRLLMRAPFVILLTGAFGWAGFSLSDGGADIDPQRGPAMMIATGVVLGVLLVMLTITVMRRPLWERHSIGLKGLVRGFLFGLLVLAGCLTVAAVLIGGALTAAPLEETPRAYLFLHRSGLIAILLLCASPGLFALVVSVRERQGYSTIARIWRIDRAQIVRGIFLIMVLTTCVAAVAIVAGSLSVRALQVAAIRLDAGPDWLTAIDWNGRAILTGIFTVIAFTTAHIVQYERIRDWESGGDVEGVFD